MDGTLGSISVEAEFLPPGVKRDSGVLGQTGCRGNVGAMSQDDGDGLTGRGGDMGLEAQGAAGTSCPSGRSRWRGSTRR